MIKDLKEVINSWSPNLWVPESTYEETKEPAEAMQKEPLNTVMSLGILIDGCYFLFC